MFHNFKTKNGETTCKDCGFGYNTKDNGKYLQHPEYWICSEKESD